MAVEERLQPFHPERLAPWILRLHEPVGVEEDKAPAAAIEAALLVGCAREQADRSAGGVEPLHPPVGLERERRVVAGADVVQVASGWGEAPREACVRPVRPSGV